MSKFKPTISNIHKKNEVLHFEISGSETYGLDKSIINGIRRILLSELPVVAFNIGENVDIQDLTIVENNGSLHNEMLLQRIGLIPLFINPDKYMNNYLFELNVECDSKVPFQFITAGDFNVYPLLPEIQKKIDDLNEDSIEELNDIDEIIKTKKMENYDMKNPIKGKKFKELFRPFVFKRNNSENYNIITELKNTNTSDKKQKIHLFGVPSLRNSKTNSRYQSVSCSTYTFVKSEELIESIFNERIKINNISDEDKQSEYKKFILAESERYYYRDFENEPYKYNFSIKSCSYFNEYDLFLRSLQLLMDKIDTIKSSLLNLLKEKESSISIIKKNDYIYHYTLNNENHTIGNIIQSHIARRCIDDKCILQLCGYNKKHPLEESILLCLTLNPKNKICNETEINKYHEINNFLIGELEIIKQEIKLLYTTSEEAFLAH